MPGAVIFFELFEIYAFGAFYRNHVVVLLFIVADEEILGVAARIGNIDTAELVHIKNCFVLGGFEFDIVGFEIIVGFLLVHVVYYSTFGVGGCCLFLGYSGKYVSTFKGIVHAKKNART